MSITRQHADTEVGELIGLVCEKLLGIPGNAPDHVIAIYLQASGHWYRCFLDAGLLFFDECVGPDREDDLVDGTDYMDLGVKLQCEGDAIEQIHMHDGTLTLRFASGVALLLRDSDEGSRFEASGERRGL